MLSKKVVKFPCAIEAVYFRTAEQVVIFGCVTENRAARIYCDICLSFLNDPLETLVITPHKNSGETANLLTRTHVRSDTLFTVENAYRVARSVKRSSFPDKSMAFITLGLRWVLKVIRVN